MDAHRRSYLRLTSASIVFGLIAFGFTQSSPAQTILVANNGAIGKYVVSNGAVTSAAPKFIVDGNEPADLVVSGPSVYAAEFSNNSIGRYDTITGAGTDLFATSQLDLPSCIAQIDNTLYVGNFDVPPADINTYDATTGALIKSQFITNIHTPGQFAFSGTNLYVTDLADGTVSEYNLTNGSRISAFSADAPNAYGVAVSGNTLYVTNSEAGTIGTYNATTGKVINASYMTGFFRPSSLTLDGDDLFVSDYGTNTVGEFDLSGATPKTINAALVTGIFDPSGIAIVPSPEPTIASLVISGAGLFLTRRRTR